MHNRFGLHWANVPIGTLGQWALGMGGDCYLVIDGGHGWIPKIREARPNAIIVHRHAVSNWMDMEPEEWANQMADLFHQHKQYTKHAELECEPDIFPNFPGWDKIETRLRLAAEWNWAVADRLRKLCRGIIIHSPPLAHERLDLPLWFRIWKPVMDACDVLDMHCYWEKGGKYCRPGLYDPKESYHRAFRYRKIHDFLESQDYHIPMMVTECGNFAPDRPDYADELIYYFSELEKDADYMIGGCVFILKSNQWNWVNDLTRQPNVEQFFGRLGQAPKKELPYPDFSGTAKKPGEKKMETPEGWENVPERIRQWYPLLWKHAMRIWPYKMIPYKDVQLHADRIGACIIERESEGNPNAVNSETGATGLMQIMPFHFEPGKDPTDPDWNIGKGCDILKDKLDKATDLRLALFWYSGRSDRPWEPYIKEYWQPFVGYYKEFFGIDIEPKPDPIQEALKDLQVAKTAIDSAEEKLLGI